jgi:glycosyltransferase involved in cell wall biosynthesis
MPKVLLEASLLGKPIVTSDIPGCREIINLFKNGILVKKKNVNSLKKSLEKLMTNKTLLNRFKKNINFSNFKKLNEDYVVKKNINCYLELLNG